MTKGLPASPRMWLHSNCRALEVALRVGTMTYYQVVTLQLFECHSFKWTCYHGDVSRNSPVQVKDQLTDEGEDVGADLRSTSEEHHAVEERRSNCQSDGADKRVDRLESSAQFLRHHRTGHDAKNGRHDRYGTEYQRHPNFNIQMSNRFCLNYDESSDVSKSTDASTPNSATRPTATNLGPQEANAPAMNATDVVATTMLMYVQLEINPIYIRALI